VCPFFTLCFTQHAPHGSQITTTQQLSTGQSGTAPPLSQFLTPKAKNWSHEGHNITAIELLFFKEYHTVAVRQNASWL
jgi:hypothetical protein